MNTIENDNTETDDIKDDNKIDILDYILNKKHDAVSYETYSCKREIIPMRKITDANAIYDAYKRAVHGTEWKLAVQKFQMNWLIGIANLQKEFENHTYKPSKGTNFIINERGKERYITGSIVQDRISEHVLCDEQLNPSIYPHMMYTNSASQKYKGVDFARNNLDKYLHQFFRQNGNSNEGFALVMDFSRFYDNIKHKELMDIFKLFVTDSDALWLTKLMLKRAEVDVSYMSDEEFANCLHETFNSLKYSKINKSLLTGKKYMKKHLNIGDQVSQTSGVCYPMDIDNYIKIVRGCKFFIRYNDDIIIIHKDLTFLDEIYIDVKEMADKKGIKINEKKSRIYKLSDGFKFLQVKYILTNTGKVVTSRAKKKIHDFRKRMCRVARQMNDLNEFDNWFNSWMGSQCKFMSQNQIKNTVDLFNKLKLKEF